MTVGLRAINPRPRALLNPALSDKEMRAGIRQYLQEVRRLLRRYPPPDPHSTYIRTEQLRDGWEIRVPSRYYGEIYNSTYYAAMVQGKDGVQRRLFRRKGWKNITTISRETSKRYGDIMNRRVVSALGIRPGNNNI